MPRIPIYVPEIHTDDRANVISCLDDNWIAQGAFVERFEAGVAAYVGVAHAVACCNGTAAVHIALAAIGVGSGDEVIVPTFTYVASVNPIGLLGATPVFVDADPLDWNQSVTAVAAAITPRTRAIVAVHLYGAVGDGGALRRLADERGIFLIEDAAEAFGSDRDGQRAGSFGHVATFSFFANKTITTGEGGMVVSDDAGLAARARKFRGQGLAGHGSYWHDEIGFNYRLTNLQAGIGVAQLARIEEILARKRRLATWYADALADTALTLQPELPGVRHSRWMMAYLAPDASTRDAIRVALAAEGIETRPAFQPIHRMPMYASSRSANAFPIADDLAARGLNLPSWPALPREAVEHIAHVIRSVAPAQPHASGIETLRSVTD